MFHKNNFYDRFFFLYFYLKHKGLDLTQRICDEINLGSVGHYIYIYISNIYIHTEEQLTIVMIGILSYNAIDKHAVFQV